MKKYGGPARLKQSCEERWCILLLESGKKKIPLKVSLSHLIVVRVGTHIFFFNIFFFLEKKIHAFWKAVERSRTSMDVLFWFIA